MQSTISGQLSQSCDNTVHMDDVLLEIVLSRLDRDELAAESSDFLLAALDGDEALGGQLSAAPSERYSRPRMVTAAQKPVGAYLSSLTVKGFRGIGPATTLTVKQGPGLTLVVGRNGSGKSSFAEGLEVLLTGNLMRWKSAPMVVKDGWRSMHAAGGCDITAEFYVEGKGRTTVVRSWQAGTGTDISRSNAWIQVHGEKQAPFEALGWETDLVGYRPFLSHAELEAFFGVPSELHDLLANVLGLEDLTAADKRLQTAAKYREEKLSAVKKDLDPLRTRLTELAPQDERAADCVKALAGNNPARWGIAAATAIATGSLQRPGDEGQIVRLRSLANLKVPTAAEVSEAAKALREAATSIANLAGSSAERARELAALLDAALRHHHANGDGPCPVCGNAGALTPDWHIATEEHRDRLRGEARAADQAVDAGKAATVRAQALVQTVPKALTAAGNQETASATAVTAWQRWVAVPKTSDTPPTPTILIALAEHLETTHGPLMTTVTTVAEEAARELASREDQWSRVADDLAVWCDSANRAREGARPVAGLKAARRWLGETTAELRAERLAPLADQSRRIWANLRQESNVNLGEFRLSGSNTRRQLDLDVTVDGEPGSALGVMSQGEINALALSIFLPRATMTASPFRFLVIDDPVQAMDPAKVDGLAKVLNEVAKDRQVIVFTHDNRLAAAIRDLSIPATVLEVTRQPGSNVTIRECIDASKQAIKDATSLSKDPNIPREVAERVIPGLCRTAAEAAFVQAYWRTQLRTGHSRGEIDESLEGNGKKLNLRALAALALFGDITEAGNVADRISRQWGPSYASTYRSLNKGAHEGYCGDLPDLIATTKAFVSKIDAELQ